MKTEQFKNNSSDVDLNNYEDVFASVVSKKEENQFQKDNLILMFLRIVVLITAPLIATARLFLPPLVLDYGNGKITTNSLLLLLFGALALLISAIYFFLVFRLWRLGIRKDEKGNRYSWKKMLRSAFAFSLFLGLLLAFFSVFTAIPQSTLKKELMERLSLKQNWSMPLTLVNLFLPDLVFVLPTFLFFLGLVLIVIGFKGLKFEKDHPVLFLRVIFLSSLLFLLIGFLPTIFLAIYWARGGI